MPEGEKKGGGRLKKKQQPRQPKLSYALSHLLYHIFYKTVPH